MVRPFSHQALKARQPGVDVECLCCEQVGFVPGALTMAMKATGLHRRPAGAQGALARRAAHAGAGGRGGLAMRTTGPMRATPPTRALAMRAPPAPRPGPRAGPADGTGRRGGGDGPRDRHRRGREGDDDTRTTVLTSMCCASAKTVPGTATGAAATGTA